jgi:predicted Zn finger-like uncharacterized protein
MKIVCDSCGTKYSISDDKVRGKVFKIRCKKCSHIIVVRGNDAASAPASAAAPAEGGGGGGWHLVVDGDQVGPISEADIRGRVERGEVNGETFVWKEGFADWLKMSAIPELAGLVAPPADGGVFADGTGSGAVAVNGDSGAHSAPNGGGLFGGAAAAAAGEDADVFGGLAPAASAAKKSGGADLFAAPAVVSKPVEESRWPAASAAPAGHDGGRVENLTGQRHENSVLFSLSNLQSLAMPAPAASKPISTAPTSEGSGLIDIRAMAATTLGSSASGGPSFGGGSAGDDLPAFGAFSPAAPVLLALPTQSGPPKWIYPVIGVAVLLVVAIGVMAFKILGAKPVTAVEAVPTAAAPAAAAPGAPAAPAAAVAVNTPPPAAPTTIPPSELPPREVATKPAEAAPATKPTEHEHHHREHSKESAKKGGDEGGKKVAVADAPAAPAPVAEKKPAKGSLDDLLESALNRKPAAPAPKTHTEDVKSDSGGGSGPLAKSAVVAGMNSIKGKVADCYTQFKVPGMAMVNFVIGKNGRVSSANVSGKFAGTPTGGCVEKAVKSATFPPSDGLSTVYPFNLK